jgi:RNA polymerase sigma-70 factor, ECF subfamily
MMESLDVTNLLNAWNNGDNDALEKLIPLIYQEFRRMAVYRLRNERQHHTLQPTALVNEAYLRIVTIKDINWKSRAHFFSVAAKLMRNILVDHARKINAEKRGGDHERVDLSNIDDILPDNQIDLIVLDEALTRLEKLDQQQSRIVELKYFAGLSIEEIAEVLNLLPRSVKYEWQLARAWLHKQLSEP